MLKTKRPRLSESEYDIILKHRNKKKRNNVLVIGDLHQPFTLDGYLEFCQKTYDKYDCGQVVFIGDIIDSHFSSYHETSPDGFGGAEELARAKAGIKKYYDVFPNAKVCIGNHDRIPNRKAFTGGISSSWIKTIDEVLETPNWEYGDSFVIDGVLYWHGDGMNIRTRGNSEAMSVVQGHLHSKSFYEVYVGEKTMRFVLQIGCGIDRHAYAMAYAKNFAKPQINAGVVMDNGRWAIIEHMNLFK